MSDNDYLILANDSDYVALILATDTVSNARMTVLSVNPFRLRDNETGEEFGLEKATATEYRDGALFAAFGQTKPTGIPCE